jgi:serine/threonine-protein kinase
MEYLRGGTLQDYLDHVGFLPSPEAAAIALEMARALDHMHRKGYHHNDLKLENIVFRQPIEAGKPFTPVLIDFGIATRLRLQAHAGSIYIMSPERLQVAQMRLAPELSPPSERLDLMKVDVWGLGVVLYRMLGGRLPFSGRNKDRLTDNIISSQPVPLHKLSEDVSLEVEAVVIDGCLAKNPDQRISMLELGKQLRRWGDGVVASKAAEQRRTFWRLGRN